MILLPMSKVTARYGRGSSSIYADIQTRLFTKPVKVGEKSSRWPDCEVDELIAARVAGWSDDQIRELVKQLEANRKK